MVPVLTSWVLPSDHLMDDVAYFPYFYQDCKKNRSIANPSEILTSFS
jgi:hypothetical protein